MLVPARNPAAQKKMPFLPASQKRKQSLANDHASWVFVCLIEASIATPVLHEAFSCRAARHGCAIRTLPAWGVAFLYLVATRFLILNNNLWIALGLAGQAVFCGRFLLQWLYSERQHRSAMPMGFWYASIAGAVMLLVFAVYKRDPVFTAGYFGGLLIYMRNLHLRWREAKGSQAGRPR